MLRGMYPPAATLPFGPLWILGFYIVVVCIAPATIWLHRRFRWWVPPVMALGAIVVDFVGFGADLHLLRYLNVAFVLLLPHQLGHFYADGTFGRLPRRVFWAMVAVGLGGLVLLTTSWVFQAFGPASSDWFGGIGHYPKSLLGTDVEEVSNAYPPTVCFLLADIWSIGAVMLLRSTLTRWLERPRPWKATIFLNGVIMTLFLWHMTRALHRAARPVAVGRRAPAGQRGGVVAAPPRVHRALGAGACRHRGARRTLRTAPRAFPRNVKPRSTFKSRGPGCRFLSGDSNTRRATA